MPSFFNGKRFFLTYPQCPDSKEALRQFLLSKGTVKYFCIARERHEDGNFHLHACVEYENVQRHSSNWLDFNGKHPNVQSPRNWNACKTYCKKDGDFIQMENDFNGVEIIAQESLQEKCKSFDKEEDWFEYCATNKIAFQYATFFWSRLHSDHITITEDSQIQGNMCSSLETFRCPDDCSKSIVIKGPSGCGKTTWAKKSAIKPALFVSHVDQLKSFRVGYHKSIIFDDCSFTHTPRTNQIAIVDCYDTRGIHCRHAVATIPSNIQRIFTCNEWPVDKTDEAIQRRCRFYTVQGWLNQINAEL